jgi:hypothetical protein
MMSEPTNKKLYEKIKRKADEIYSHPSAYKSGYIVKEYKKAGGKYVQKKEISEIKPLKRWFAEEWKDIGHKDYPVYRPTKRINKKTPLTPDEIDEKNLKKQVKLKQKIKGDKNLPPFIKKSFPSK